jgi:hypothetical protein
MAMSLKRTLSAALLGLLPVWAAAQQPGPPEDEQARLTFGYLSRAESLDPEKIQILDESRATLPTLGIELRLFKVLDERTAESRRVALDSQNRRVDYEKLLQAERAAQYKKYGTMHPELHRLVEMAEQKTIPVIIRFAVEERRIDKSKFAGKRGLEVASAEAREAEKDAVEQASRIFRQVARKHGLAEEDRVTRSGPFVAAEMPVGAIRELSRDPRVAFIGLDQEVEIPDYPTIPESLPTTGTNIAHSLGANGAGIKIGVLESGTPNVSSSCFRLGATQTGGSANSHMTKSLAIIGNRYSAGACTGSWQGYAPDATVLLANGGSYTDRYEWAKSQGVNVATMSWHYPSEETSGALHSRDIYFDYWTTRWPWPTVFTSAGNQADLDAYASGKGYNFLGVGNVLNDGDGNRCNDAISDSSSFENPTSPHNDREVPEIASPGSRHELLNTSFGGTSAATPVTAAIAAVLMSKNTSLKIWPEAIRAILLASATYQQADGANWSKYSDGKDGAGLTSAYYGYYTAGRREAGTTAQYRAHDYGSLTKSSFSGGFLTKTWTAKTFTTKSRIRVALTWNSKVSASGGSPSGSVLDADLDLRVYDPKGSLVAWSSTWDSSYEFVEFTPSKTGNYTIKVRGYSVPNDFWSYFGIAWTTHYELCS